MTQPKRRICFSRHARFDGGRTDHLTVDGRSVGHWRENVADDPRLLWWIDCELQSDEPGDARAVFRNRIPDFAPLLDELAESLEAGIDPDGFPVSIPSGGDDPFVVRTSAVRRFGDGQYAEAVRRLRDELPQSVDRVAEDLAAA